ncbi:hypothetical protein [Actinoplanes sp. NPDC051851]|uniref:hypothetical protein n=1 Tax=Actinoplanes sp. NPDC051851 TaxID=3154753 RepID=UPI00343E0208
MIKPPSPLSGFWALLVGGGVLAVVLALAGPALRVEDCSNYGGAGNASTFRHLDEVQFLLLLGGWILLVLVEQFLPVTVRGRAGTDVFARAIAAVMIALTGSCCLFLGLGSMCH